MGKYFVTILIMLNVSVGLCQDTTRKPQTAFERITGAVKEYKLDTSSAPDDKITRKIIELRSLRGGFNIDEDTEAYKQVTENCLCWNESLERICNLTV